MPRTSDVARANRRGSGFRRRSGSSRDGSVSPPDSVHIIIAIRQDIDCDFKTEIINRNFGFGE